MGYYIPAGKDAVARFQGGAVIKIVLHRYEEIARQLHRIALVPTAPVLIPCN